MLGGLLTRNPGYISQDCYQINQRGMWLNYPGNITVRAGAQPGDKNFLQTNGVFLC
jgi:hypothetical protein